MIKNYFNELFATSLPRNIDAAYDVVKGKMEERHMNWCASPFTADEIELALKQMHPLKALGLDGVPALFFQKYWKVVGKDITKLVLEILNESRDPTPLNNTFIALISR